MKNKFTMDTLMKALNIAGKGANLQTSMADGMKVLQNYFDFDGAYNYDVIIATFIGAASAAWLLELKNAAYGKFKNAFFDDKGRALEKAASDLASVFLEIAEHETDYISSGLDREAFVEIQLKKSASSNDKEEKSNV